MTSSAENRDSEMKYAAVSMSWDCPGRILIFEEFKGGGFGTTSQEALQRIFGVASRNGPARNGAALFHIQHSYCTIAKGSQGGH